MNTVSPADPGDTHLVDDATPPRGIPTFPDRADSSSSGASQGEVDGRDEASPAPGDGPVPLPQPVASQVTAVIVTNGHTPYLRPLLVSLVGHDLLPGRIVLADVSVEGTAQLPSGLSWPVRPEIVRVPGRKILVPRFLVRWRRLIRLSASSGCGCSMTIVLFIRVRCLRCCGLWSIPRVCRSLGRSMFGMVRQVIYSMWVIRLRLVDVGSPGLSRGV